MLLGLVLACGIDTPYRFYRVLSSHRHGNTDTPRRGTTPILGIDYTPAGSLRLGAAPQATSLPEGGIAACRRCQCARWLFAIRYFPDPPGIGGAPKGSLVKGAACRRCQCARWLFAIRYYPDPPGIGGAPKGSLVKGSWHAGGVTEGLHSRHFS